MNYKDLKPGGVIIVNTGSFSERDLAKAKLDTNRWTTARSPATG